MTVEANFLARQSVFVWVAHDVRPDRRISVPLQATNGHAGKPGLRTSERLPQLRQDS